MNLTQRHPDIIIIINIKVQILNLLIQMVKLRNLHVNKIKMTKEVHHFSHNEIKIDKSYFLLQDVAVFIIKDLSVHITCRPKL